MSNLNTKEIILVEDDTILRKAFTGGLMDAGFKVFSVMTGEEGIELAKTKKPNLILLDLTLPRMNGFDALKILKSDSKTQNIPVIILTNTTDETKEKESKELGAVDYLVKANWSMEDLVSRIGEVLKNKGGD